MKEVGGRSLTARTT